MHHWIALAQNWLAATDTGAAADHPAIDAMLAALKRCGTIRPDVDPLPIIRAAAAQVSDDQAGRFLTTALLERISSAPPAAETTGNGNGKPASAPERTTGSPPPLQIDVDEQIEAARFLHRQGHHLVLADKDTKAAFVTGWEDRPETLAAVIRHLRKGGLIGIVYGASNLLGIDVDTPKDQPRKADELQSKIESVLGTDALICVLPSHSHYREGSGRRYLVYSVPQYALGLKDDGSPRNRFARQSGRRSRS